MIRFQHIEYLWLLLFIPLFVISYLYFLNWRKNKIKKIGDPKLISPLFKGRISGRSTTQMASYSFAFLCGILALANLQIGTKAEKIERKGLDITFALDVSNSMLAKDFSPDRITVAKQLIFRMVDQMKNDRAGLVIFAGNAYLQVPLTIDYSALKMLLTSVKPGMIPTQGTVLAKAIAMADESFNEEENKHRAIVLISDGEDHDEQAEEVAKQAAKNGTIIYTVGIGSPEGSTIFDPTTGKEKVDNNGQIIITKLNEKELINIAHAANGSYVQLSNINQTAQQILKEINKLETKSMGEVLFTNYKSYFQYFIGGALIFLLIGSLLPQASLIFPKTKFQKN